MDKKEHKHPGEESHHHEASCNCGPDCKCGCQEGGPCHCGDHCHCGCGCPCQRKAAKVLGAVLIFALGFVAAKFIGCKPCTKHMHLPKIGMHAPAPMPMPMMPHYTDGTGNTIIIINTDGSADVSRFLDGSHPKGCPCGCNKHHKHGHPHMMHGKHPDMNGKHHKMHGAPHPHFDKDNMNSEKAMPENVKPDAPETVSLI